MTAVLEGEYDNVSNTNTNDNQVDNESTLDGTAGENKAPKSSVSELAQFLSKHDLMDMHLQITSSKLRLSHLIKADKSDLDGLCSDLNLSSSQKIRLKHAIKSLQKRKIIRKRMKHKVKSNALASKKKASHQPKSSMNKAKNKDHPHHKLKSKLVIVGQAAVGKTTLQKAMMGYEFEPGTNYKNTQTKAHLIQFFQ